MRTVLNVRDRLSDLLGRDAEARSIFGKAVGIVHTLRAAGHEAWFVGGSVRDLLLSRRILDIDITGSAGPEQVAALFPRTVAVGESFGVVRVMVGSHQFEVALYRREEGYSDGRHPDTVAPGTLEQDVERRDFTVNGLVMDPDSGDVVDLVGGLDDLEHRCLRAIGNPEERMAEDYLRTLRAVRFSACLDFHLDPATRDAVTAAAPGLARISRERVRAELEKMAHNGGAARGLALMFELALLDHTLPHWAGASRAGVETATRLFGRLPSEVDLVQWMTVVVLSLEEDLLARPYEGRRIRELSVLLADSMRLSVNERRRLEHRLLIAVKMVHVRGARQARRVDLYRSESFEEVHGLVKALLSGRGMQTDALDDLSRERQSLPPERLKPARFLTGGDLAAAGIPAGPRVGALLAECEDLAAEGELGSRDEALAWLTRRLNFTAK